jgi:methionyl-tRNA formyltransferase
VFAYHDVGVRCLKTLISGGVDIPLVVTVADDPNERQWFASVAATAADYGIDAITPDDANTPAVVARVAAAKPDFIFSFYYRALLGGPLLALAPRGALNMHGSLLPRYRGRAPVNWAILNGELETGATLHYMVDRADAGDIVDQQAVPILRDDDAREVFAKLTVAAEMVLARSLPLLVAGRERRIPQTIVPGSYFGRRRPEDGRIDWSQPAERIHNLVRAVAPPFPGAFTEVQGQRWSINRTRVVSGSILPSNSLHHPERNFASTQGGAIGPGGSARLSGAGGKCLAACRDGGVLEILSAASTRGPLDLETLARELEQRPVML